MSQLKKGMDDQFVGYVRWIGIHKFSCRFIINYKHHVVFSRLDRGK